MIIVNVFAQDSPQVPLVEDDHVVETLQADRSDYPFDERILPRGARWRKDLLDAETLDATVEVPTVDLISIPQQITEAPCPMERRRRFAVPSTPRRDDRSR